MRVAIAPRFIQTATTGKDHIGAGQQPRFPRRKVR